MTVREEMEQLLKQLPITYEKLSTTLKQYISDMTDNDPYGYLLGEIDGVDIDNSCTPDNFTHTLKTMDGDSLHTLITSLLQNDI